MDVKTIRFSGRCPSPNMLAVGVNGDHRTTRILFDLSGVATDGCAAYVKLALSTPAKIQLTLSDGLYAWDVTRGALAAGVTDAQIQVEQLVGTTAETVWQSQIIRLHASDRIDADGALEESAQPAILTVTGLVGQAETARDAAVAANMAEGLRRGGFKVVSEVER